MTQESLLCHFSNPLTNTIISITCVCVKNWRSKNKGLYGSVLPLQFRKMWLLKRLILVLQKSMARFSLTSTALGLEPKMKWLITSGSKKIQCTTTLFTTMLFPNLIYRLFDCLNDVYLHKLGFLSLICPQEVYLESTIRSFIFPTLLALNKLH